MATFRLPPFCRQLGYTELDERTKGIFVLVESQPTFAILTVPFPFSDIQVHLGNIVDIIVWHKFFWGPIVLIPSDAVFSLPYVLKDSLQGN